MRWEVSKNDGQRLERLGQYSSVDHEGHSVLFRRGNRRWDQEVGEQGYRSRSAYLYELIQEARTYRKQGFEGRRELSDDLLMKFEEGHYRGFLAGIVLQIEGVLGDLVEEAGGDIVEAEVQDGFGWIGASFYRDSIE